MIKIALNNSYYKIMKFKECSFATIAVLWRLESEGKISFPVHHHKERGKFYVGQDGNLIKTNRKENLIEYLTSVKSQYKYK